MDIKSLFYQESGKINLLGAFFSYAVCLIMAMILGYAYTIVNLFMPIIYIKFFITLGFGLILGLLIRLLGRISHNRNKKSRIVQAVIFGLIANYFQWVAYILYAYTGEFPKIPDYLSNVHLIIQPSVFFGTIAEINEVGLWSLFGATFKGLPLLIIWLFEIVIICTGPIVAVYITQVYPYSERLGQWYPKYTLFIDFESLVTPIKFQEKLQIDPLKAIQELGMGNGLRHTKIHIFYLKDEEKQYLTFERIYIEGGGRGKKDSDIVINNFAIDKVSADAILTIFKHKREQINVI